MAIADYISKLDSQRKALADNLTEMGVASKRTETLDMLVPKVLEIPQSGSEAKVLFNSSDYAGYIQDVVVYDTSTYPATVPTLATFLNEHQTAITETGEIYYSSTSFGVPEIVTASTSVCTPKKITFELSADNTYVDTWSGGGLMGAWFFPTDAVSGIDEAVSSALSSLNGSAITIDGADYTVCKTMLSNAKKHTVSFPVSVDTEKKYYVVWGFKCYSGAYAKVSKVEVEEV